jgi:hypothetical protein
MNSDSNSSPGYTRINRTLPYILYGAFVSACFFYAALIASGMLRGSGEGIAIAPPVPLPVLIAGLSLFNISAALMLGQVIRPPDSPSPHEFFRFIALKLILQCALFEAIAIYGLIAHLFGMAPVPSLIVVGFGLLCLLTLMPGLQNQMDRLQTLKRQSEFSED